MSMTTDAPTTMRAFVLTGHGDRDQLIYHTDWLTSSPGADEVLIRVDWPSDPLSNRAYSSISLCVIEP